MTPGSSEAAGGAGDERLWRPRPRAAGCPPTRTRAGRTVGAWPRSKSPPATGAWPRGRRTRRNVAGALIDLLCEGEPDPTAKAVAASGPECRSASSSTTSPTWTTCTSSWPPCSCAASGPTCPGSPPPLPRVEDRADRRRTVPRSSRRPPGSGAPWRAALPRPVLCCTASGRRGHAAARGPEGHLRPRVDGVADRRPGRVSRRDGHLHVLGGLGAPAHDVGRRGRAAHGG